MTSFICPGDKAKGPGDECLLVAQREIPREYLKNKCEEDGIMGLEFSEETIQVVQKDLNELERGLEPTIESLHKTVDRLVKDVRQLASQISILAQNLDEKCGNLETLIHLK